MNRSSEETESSEFFCFRTVSFELDGEAQKSDRKIKQYYKRLGREAPSSQHITSMRRLRDALSKEIRLFEKSKYYRGPMLQVASFDDFVIAEMIDDFSKSFPEFSQRDMGDFVRFSIYGNYIR